MQMPEMNFITRKLDCMFSNQAGLSVLVHYFKNNKGLFNTFLGAV